MRVAVCRKVFLFVIRVKRKSTKSSLAARLFVTPSICVSGKWKRKFAGEKRQRDERAATASRGGMKRDTYTYATVVENTKAVFNQVIVHCWRRRGVTSVNHASPERAANLVMTEMLAEVTTAPLTLGFLLLHSYCRPHQYLHEQLLTNETIQSCSTVVVPGTESSSGKTAYKNEDEQTAFLWKADATLAYLSIKGSFVWCVE